jgi:hypothetical protein
MLQCVTAVKNILLKEGVQNTVLWSCISQNAALLLQENNIITAGYTSLTGNQVINCLFDCELQNMSQNTRNMLGNRKYSKLPVQISISGTCQNKHVPFL